MMRWFRCPASSSSVSVVIYCPSVTRVSFPTLPIEFFTSLSHHLVSARFYPAFFVCLACTFTAFSHMVTLTILVNIDVTKEGVRFSGSGDLGTGSVMIKPQTAVDDADVIFPACPQNLLMLTEG